MKKLIVQHRRGTKEAWETPIQILEGEEILHIPADGEIVIEKNGAAPKLKIGDGQHTYSEIPYITEELEEDIATERLRIDNLVAGPGDPLGGTWESEVADIRITANQQHTTAGDAVRFIESKVDALSDDLESFRNAEAVDGLHYVDNKLYLKAGSKILYNSEVTIVSGTGGGGGSSSQIDLYPLPEGSSTSFSVVKSDDRISIKFMFKSRRNNRPTGNFSCQLFKGEYSPAASPVAEYSFSQQADGSSIDITDYLNPGQTTLTIKCIDIYTNYMLLTYKINLIDLKLICNFNQYQVFDLNDSSKQVRISYTPEGSIQRTAYLRLYDTEEDGTKIIDANTGEPVYSVLETQSILKGDTSEKRFIVDKSKLKHGANLISIQLEAWDETSKQLLRSDELFFDILANNSINDTAPMIGSTISYSSVPYGSLISIPYLIYHADAQLDAAVERTISYMDGSVEITYSRTSLAPTASLTTWTTTDYPSPDVLETTLPDQPKTVKAYFTIKYTSGSSRAVKRHEILITESEAIVQPIADSLVLQLSADNKSNEMPDRDSWVYAVDDTSIDTSFENFNWVTTGWKNHYDPQNPTQVLDKSLRLSGPAKAEINFDPFYAINLQDTGLTFEIDFSVSNVSNPEEVFINCMSNSIGFEATGNTAYFKIPGASVSAYYKDGAKVKLTGVIEQLTGNRGKFMYLYINGVMSNVVEITASSAQHSAYIPIRLGNANGILDIFSLRIYDKALTSSEVLRNYIADLPSVYEKSTVSEFNSIYAVDKDTNFVTDIIDYEAVKSRIPTILLRGDLPPAKGEDRDMKMDFNHPDVSKSFSNVFGGLIDVNVDVQGTSSAAYPRKNWKIKFKDKTKNYKLIDNAPATNVFCIKVDFAEGTGTHNTQNANLIETFYQDLDLNKLPPQQYDPSIRTTISGFPAALFVQKDVNSPIEFYAKCNFNFDKGSKNVFGFTGDNVECWEFCNNKEICNFKHDFETDHYWLSDFEPRYTSYDFDTLEELEEEIELTREASITEIQEKFERDTAGLDETSDEYKTLKDAYDKKIALVNSFEYESTLCSNYESLINLRTSMISEFKKLFDWVLSTDPETVHKNDAGEIDPLPLPEEVKIGDLIFTHDTAEYRENKFRAEFENYFDIDYAAIYYVYTFVALMIDQRAKNMFLTRWVKEDENGELTSKWYPYFYDNDSCFGIDNSGNLDYDYYHEDTSIVGNETVFTGASSVLWNNFRKQFPSVIQRMYNQLKSKKMNLNDMLHQFITEGAKKWSEALYNEDSQAKYLALADPSLPETDYHPEYIYNVKGTGELQLEYFLSNRFAYCDSKWRNSAYTEDILVLRPSSDDIIPEISLTPSIDMYCGVEFGKGGTTVRKLLKAGQNTNNIFSEKYTGDNVETNIWGVSKLSSLGDLSPLKTTQFYGSGAIRLTELILGNHDPEYTNPSLKELTVPASPLLKKLDITNCTGLGKGDNKNIDVRDSQNIQEIYAEGTNLENIILPDDGYLTTLHLPQSIKTLKIINHPDLTIDNLNAFDDSENFNYPNITELHISGCAGLSSSLNRIFEACLCLSTVKLERVQLSEVDWEITNLDHLRKLYLPDGYGLASWDEQGIDTSNYLNIEGSCKLKIYDENKEFPKQIPGDIMAEIREHFPKLRFTLEDGCYVRSTVTFYEDDLITEYHKEIVDSYTADANAIKDPSLDKYKKPSRESTAQYQYIFNGWSKDPNPDRSAQIDALENILGDRKLYPAFTRSTRSYRVTFMTGDVELYSETLEYGTKLSFNADKVSDDKKIYLIEDENGKQVPRKTEVDDPKSYIFIGWSYPENQPITGDTISKAQFTFSNDSIYEILISDINYKVDNQDRLIITQYNNIDASIAKLQDTYEIQDKTYKPYSLDKSNYVDENGDPYTGFSNSTIELIDLGKNLEVLGDRTFQSADRLHTVYIGENVKYLGEKVFDNCKELATIHFNAADAYLLDSSNQVSFLGSNPGNLYDIIIENKVKKINPFIFSYSNAADSAKSCKVLDLSSAENCEIIEYCAFQNLRPLEIKFPQSGKLKEIGMSAFAYNDNITSLDIPEGVEDIGNGAFDSYTNLKSIKLPVSLTLSSAGMFRNCPNIAEFIVPAGSLYAFEGNSVIQRTNSGGIKLILSTLTSIVDNSITEFADFAFHNKLHLTTFTIPKNVTRISANCFEQCSNLSNIELHNNIKVLGNACFNGTALSGTLVLGDNIEELQSSFISGTKIERVIVPNNENQLQNFGYVPFQNASELTEVYLLNTGNAKMTLINNKYQLFFGNSKLTDIYVGWSKEAAGVQGAEGWEYRWNASSNVKVHFETTLEAQDGRYKVTSKDIDGNEEVKYINV